MMLKKLTIEQYKGFYASETLEFALHDNVKNGSGLTLIVGPNNSGKTSVIEALLLNVDKRFKETERHKGQQPKIIIEKDQETIEFTNIDNGSQIKQMPADCQLPKLELIPSRRYWDSYSGGRQAPAKFIEHTVQQSVRNAAAIDTAAVLKDINTNQSLKVRFNDYIKKVIPHFKEWTIETSEQNDYVKYITDTAEHQFNLLGDGVISIFRICAHLVADDKERILIIDEPELSLHPTAQKSLSKIISLASKERQVILCTHSPHFVNWDDFVNGAKFIRLNKPDDKECRIFGLDSQKPYTNLISKNHLDYQRPQMLDYVAKEILFYENVLFVEGQEDVGLIKKWLYENNVDYNFEIFGYGVGSYVNIKLMLEMAKDLGLTKVIALYDNGENEQRAYRDDNVNYSEFKLELLETTDMRDKHDDNGNLIKEGCFDRHGKLKPDRKEYFERLIKSFIAYFS